MAPPLHPAQTAHRLTWAVNAEIASAYVRAVRTGDERQPGQAVGYTEAGGTIEARAARLLDGLLTECAL